MTISALISRRRRTVNINGVEYKTGAAREFLREITEAVEQLEAIEKTDKRKTENHPLAQRYGFTPEHPKWTAIKPLIHNLKKAERDFSQATYTAGGLPVKTTKRINGRRIQKLTEEIETLRK
jgi:hypothetical protein